MEKNENKEEIKPFTKENKKENKSEKTLLKAKKGEIEDFPKEEENVLKNDLEKEEKESFDEFMEALAQEEAELEENELDELLGDWGDDDLEDIEESTENPLSEYEGEPASDNEPNTSTEKIEDVQERVSSEKNRRNLDRLGAKLLDKVDHFKASLCSQISGQHLAEYVADEEMKDILLECIKEYLATKEVKELSPFGALMAALAMWTLPPLGMAVLDRFQVKKEAKAKQEKTLTNLNKTAPQEEEAEGEQEQGEAISDYSHLKEYQEQRKIFSTNSAGKYNYTANGTYIKVDLADEYPSSEVKAWLDEGLKDRAIKKRLGYG